MVDFSNNYLIGLRVRNYKFDLKKIDNQIDHLFFNKNFFFKKKMESDSIIDDTTVNTVDEDDNVAKFKNKKRRSPTYQHYTFNESDGRWYCKYCR